MTDFSALLVPDRGQAARTLHIVHPDSWETWLAAQPPRSRAIVAAHRLTGRPGNRAVLPGDAPDDWAMLLVCNEAKSSPWRFASLGEQLPEGHYRLADGDPEAGALGWLLAQHRFDRYKPAENPAGPRVLLTPDPARIDELVALAESVALARDLINTPAEDMGPAELQAVATKLATDCGASLTVTMGDALTGEHPLIHTVGRAAAPGREPRLIELEWGQSDHPRIAIIGKGVCFDTGGLDLKPAGAMRLMKKDMGGAAHALALARLVMQRRLPVRLHLLIPAVENAVSGPAMRPGDVLRSRKGLTVEVSNTDAEGRLILADALARAAEGGNGTLPELMLDFATLTGAARVALGPELPALFANDDRLAGDLAEAAGAVHDPLWRLPLWAGYDEMLRSDIADLDNAPEGGMAGAITAALFLQRFVPPAIPWAHLDTFAWAAKPRPGRPKGGEALGLRAAWAMLRARYAR